jgi:hypothetical protein
LCGKIDRVEDVFDTDRNSLERAHLPAAVESLLNTHGMLDQNVFVERHPHFVSIAELLGPLDAFVGKRARSDGSILQLIDQLRDGTAEKQLAG